MRYVKKYSVVIVGAGPSGATAAKGIAENGIDVLCIDKHKFPRDKPCGGALSIHLLQTHPQLEKYVETNVLAGCIASGDNRYRLEYDSGERLGALIQRSNFDNALLSEAKKAGAEILEGERVTSVETSSQGVIVKTNNDQYNAEIVLGAGGTNDIVAKSVSLNPQWRSSNLALSYVIEPKLPEQVLDEYFSPKRKLCFHLGFGGIDGYGWVFPKKEHLNVGFGASMSATPKIQDYFQEYIKFCQKLNIIPPFSLPKTQAALIPMRNILPSIYANRTLLLGDAAGFVNPLNGEGIQYAIESGEIAGKIVSRTVRLKQYGVLHLREYQSECMQQFGYDLQGLQFLSKILMKHNTLVVKLATKDLVLKDLALKMVQNVGDLKKIKRKLIKRFLRTLIVNTFRK